MDADEALARQLNTPKWAQAAMAAEEAADVAAALNGLHVRSGGSVAQEGFMSHVEDCIRKVLSYENELPQAMAMSVMDLDGMQSRAQDAAALSTVLEDASPLAVEEALAEELVAWFKRDFFSWVDRPACEFCGCASPAMQRTEAPTLAEQGGGASRTEVYRCPLCDTFTRFPRYNDPVKLLETRRGRCGEWANCFSLCCRAAGLEVRLVYDTTDHVWVEYFSQAQQKWVHIDPCEGIVDKPLLYEQGWGKRLAYCVGVGRHGIADVTQRYTKDFPALLPRRRLGEGWLEGYVKHTNERLWDRMPVERRNEIVARHEADVADMGASCAVPLSDEERALPGRITGTPEWVAARGEGGPGDATTTAGAAAGGGVPKSKPPPPTPAATRYRWARDESLGAQHAQRICGGTVRASSENAPSETVDKAFDGNVDTKWLDFAGAQKDASWLEYRLLPTAQEIVLKKYALVSANDSPERDPRHVIVEAWVESTDSKDPKNKNSSSKGKGEEEKKDKNDNGGRWVAVDEQKEIVFTQRGERVEFEVAADGPLARRFRLRIVSVADPGAANSVQLAGWELYGESESSMLRF